MTTKRTSMLLSLLLLAACDAGASGGGPPLHLVAYEGSHVLAIDQAGEGVVAGVGSSLAHLPASGLRPGAKQRGLSLSSVGYNQLEINAIAISPRDRTVAVGGTGQIHMSGWVGPSGGGGMAGDIQTGGPVHSLDFSPDGAWLAASSGVYDVKTQQLLASFTRPAEGEAAPEPLGAERAMFVRFVKGGAQVLVIGPGLATLHDARTGAHLQTLDGCAPTSTLSVLAALSPDRTHLVFADDLAISSCRLSGDAWAREAKQHKLAERPRALAFSPDGASLAVAADRSIFTIKSEDLSLIHHIDTARTSNLGSSMSLNPAMLDLVWDPQGPHLFVFRADNQLATYTLP